MADVTTKLEQLIKLAAGKPHFTEREYTIAEGQGALAPPRCYQCRNGLPTLRAPETHGELCDYHANANKRWP